MHFPSLRLAGSGSGSGSETDAGSGPGSVTGSGSGSVTGSVTGSGSVTVTGSGSGSVTGSVLRFLPRLALLLLALPLAACFLARPVEKPTAQVRDVSLGAASFTTLLGELSLDVHNPNAFGVPLSGIEWELSVGGARAITGRADLSQTIPARGVAPVATTLRVDLREAADVAAALSRGARDYRLVARLHFATQLGDLAVDLQHQGSLSSAGGLLGSLDGIRW